MTPKELAEILNGREYGEEMTKAEEARAKESGLVVLFGASDDLAEFRGSIDDEVDAYNGADLFVHSGGVLERHEDCECEFCGYKAVRSKARLIKALWCPPGDPKLSWAYTTDLPHAMFNIMEGSEIYCRGIVFQLEDLKRES